MLVSATDACAANSPLPPASVPAPVPAPAPTPISTPPLRLPNPSLQVFSSPHESKLSKGDVG